MLRRYLTILTVAIALSALQALSGGPSAPVASLSCTR